MKRNRIFSGILSAVMLCTAVTPGFFISAQADGASDAAALYTYDFEDGDISAFTGRGGVETIEVSTDKAYSGEKSMCVSGRTATWNGPQFSLSEHCEAGVEYTVSAWVCPEWYDSAINLSMEYTDADGERHYSNLSTLSGDGWQEFSDIKVSFSDDVTNVYVYFEWADKGSKLYIDDFVLKSVPDVEIQEDIPSLKDVYSDYFKIGTALTPSDLVSKPLMALVEKHFSGSITVGNEMKPDYVLNQSASIAYAESHDGDDTNPQVSFTAAKKVLEYCAANNIPVRVHTLVWHSQTPDWFFKEGYQDDGDWVSEEKMIQRMENYIKNYFETLTAEYPDVDFYACDVVNEAWKDDGTPRTAGSNNDVNGQSAWVKVFGDNSFIEYAFTFARKYAPEGCKLYYNDYNEYISGKTDAIYNMAMDLKSKGLIDGIGMQSHLDVTYPTASQYKTALEKFASTGLDIQVTELDVTTSDTSEAGFETQAQYYSDIFDAIVEYKDNISAVIFWGVTDDGSWRASGCPLLFDGDYMAKPAYYSIIDDISYTTAETTTTTTTTTTTVTEETTVSETTTVTEETTASETTTVTEETAASETTTVTEETTTSETTTTGDTIEILCGDVNADGTVTIVDIIYLNKYLSKLIELNEHQLVNSDCTGEGEITASDATALLKFLGEKVPSLPIL